MRKSITINIQGQEAVNAGYKFQNGYCYRQILDHGKFLGQLEVVLDSEEVYNGFTQKWVSVYGIAFENVEKTLKQLARLGFSGMPCLIEEEREFEPSDNDNFCYCVELCAVII